MLSFLDKEYKDVIKQEFGSTAAAAKEWPKILKKKYAALPILMPQNYTD